MKVVVTPVDGAFVGVASQAPRAPPPSLPTLNRAKVGKSNLGGKAASARGGLWWLTAMGVVEKGGQRRPRLQTTAASHLPDGGGGCGGGGSSGGGGGGGGGSLGAANAPGRRVSTVVLAPFAATAAPWWRGGGRLALSVEFDVGTEEVFFTVTAEGLTHTHTHNFIIQKASKIDVSASS
jgi:hypothetical protein